MTFDEKKIGDIAFVFDGPHATPQKTDQGPYFMSISSFSNGSFDLSKSAHLSEDDYKKWTKRVTPTDGDVLFSYETRLGEAALMPSGVRACLGRRMGLLRPDFQRKIVARTIPGSTVKRISLTELPDFPIRIPKIQTQKRIIKILKPIDQKIALNRQINQTLEEMAGAIFKSWFVDFEPVKAKMAALDEGRDPQRAAMATISGKTEAEELGKLASLSETADLFPSELMMTDNGPIPFGWNVSEIKERAGSLQYGYTARPKSKRVGRYF